MNTMTIKHITAYIAAAGLLFNLTACSDFLEEQSQSEVIPKTANDFRELLMGSGYLNNDDEPFGFTYLLDDDVEFQHDSPIAPGSSASAQYQPTYSWQPSFVDIDGIGQQVAETPNKTAYAKYYERIMGCNAVLDNIEGSIGSQEQKDRVRAEALAMRAFYYFRLTNIYGDPYSKNPEGLAVPLKLRSDVDPLYSQRASVKAVYQQVLTDLQEAARLLDPLQIVRGDFHINQRTIHILLSRVYLYMEDWDNCIAEANRVFEMGGRIAVLPAMSTNPDGTPIPSTYLTYDNPEVEWVYGGNTQPVQFPYIPNRAFIQSFVQNDARASYFSYKANTNNHLLSKLPAKPDLGQVIRSSEALLNRAEAYAQKQEVALGTKDLNQLRSNRISDYSEVSFGSAEELLQAVRDERRKEFCYEGFRWFDLRRYGMPAITHTYQAAPGEAVVTYTLEKEDPMYVLPFPKSLTSRNVQLIQNPSAKMPDRVAQ